MGKKKYLTPRLEVFEEKICQDILGASSDVIVTDIEWDLGGEIS